MLGLIPVGSCNNFVHIFVCMEFLPYWFLLLNIKTFKSLVLPYRVILRNRTRVIEKRWKSILTRKCREKLDSVEIEMVFAHRIHVWYKWYTLYIYLRLPSKSTKGHDGLVF